MIKEEVEKTLVTILVADDDEVIRSFIKTLLEKSGYKVIEAIDGEDAIDKFREYKDDIQLLIIDVIMPKINGEEVYQEIKKVKSDIMAIFTSGYDEDFLYHKGVLEEGKELILKPFLPKELLIKVKDILN